MQKIEKNENGVYFSSKKPSVYKASSKEVKKSSILKQKILNKQKKQLNL